MLTHKQIQKISLLSDTVLYTEAVRFVRGLVRDQDCNPLPTSQVTGLLNIAEAFNYDELNSFIKNQRERDWPPSKRDIKTFYTALEEVLGTMYRKRLKDEFHLLDGINSNEREIKREKDVLMAQLAREFIQHLVAENGLLATEIADQRMQQRSYRR